MVTNLTTQQIESIQIDEGVIILNYGESDEQYLAPTRGGGEFTASVTVRDIEFDGRHGKTAGTQAIEEQNASLKVTTIGLTQENLARAIPNCTVEGDGSLSNPRTGVIPLSAYLKNVTMFCRLISGAYKKITIYNAMHETGIGVKAVQKAEGELALEFHAHYHHSDLDGRLWNVAEADAIGDPVFVSAVTQNATKIYVTFNAPLDSTTVTYGNFTVMMSDASKAVSAAALKSGDNKTVELTVASLTAGKTITVAYTKGTLKGTNGVAVKSFSAKPVTNTLSA